MIKRLIKKWFPRPTVIPDIEIDIEHMPVCSVERINKRETEVCFIKDGYPSNGHAQVYFCSIEQHNDFVTRFRLKLAKMSAERALTATVTAAVIQS